METFAKSKKRLEGKVKTQTTARQATRPRVVSAPKLADGRVTQFSPASTPDCGVPDEQLEKVKLQTFSEANSKAKQGLIYLSMKSAD